MRFFVQSKDFFSLPTTCIFANLCVILAYNLFEINHLQMQAHFEYVGDAPNRSFVYRCVKLPYFDAPYHYHPEYELTLITHSEGKRFIGHDIADFVSGDLVLVGANLPHCWKNDNPQIDNQAEGIVIQFREDFLGEELWQKPEFAPINKLLRLSKGGLAFGGQVKTRVGREMRMMVGLPAFQQVLCLLDLLQTLATSAEYQQLNPVEVTMLPSAEYERINKVYSYVVENFRQEIHLDDAAASIGMTSTAFCRYFKRVTKKTFIDVVTEYRVKYACQLLVNHPDKTATEVCFESGFGNLSHFNKQFKTITQRTPLHYRKEFAKS
jgi:AraC-like DNA-binding protein